MIHALKNELRNAINRTLQIMTLYYNKDVIFIFDRKMFFRFFFSLGAAEWVEICIFYDKVG